MKSLPFSKIRTFTLALAIFILTGGIGYRLGERHARKTSAPPIQVLTNQETPSTLQVDFTVFWDVWQRLHRYYIDAAGINTQKMVWGAITGMVGSLEDPYTIFLPPKENKEFKEDIGGAFQGIGAQLGLKDGRVIVIAPLKGTPAEQAGILPMDWILKVNDEETTGWTLPQAVSKIRGTKGTKVTLAILHEKAEKPEDIIIVRDEIVVPSVESWVKTPSQMNEISGVASASAYMNNPNKIAYIRLSRFGDRTNDEWNTAVEKTVLAAKKNGGLKGLILDLRNNPGGYLDGSVFIASEFLKSGVIVSQANSDKTKDDYTVNRQGKLTDIPLVVLINKGSASASEIVAGALKDYTRATVIGETSFGKGTVQTPQELSGGAGLHITTGKWLLPKGSSISKIGVKPDIEVTLDGISPAEIATMDAQLEKAVELLLQ